MEAKPKIGGCNFNCPKGQDILITKSEELSSEYEQ